MKCNDIPVNSTQLAADEGDDYCYTKTTAMQSFQRRLHVEAGYLLLYLNIAELLPSVLTIPLYGWLSDRFKRRKFMMWLPCLANVAYAAGFILANRAANDRTMSILASVVATLLVGLSGNAPGFMAGNAAYISDTDTQDRRAVRLAGVELTIGATFAVSTLGLGYWVRWRGFEEPLWFILATAFIALFLTLFLHESADDDNGETDDFLLPSCDVTTNANSNCSSPIPSEHGDSLAFWRNLLGCKTHLQRRLWILIVAFQLYLFVQQGQERTMVLFLQNEPLCWNSVSIGWFIFALMLLSGLGCYPGLLLLNKCCSELAVAIAALVSKATGSIALGFASDSIAAYICE